MPNYSVVSFVTPKERTSAKCQVTTRGRGPRDNKRKIGQFRNSIHLGRNASGGALWIQRIPKHQGKLICPYCFKSRISWSVMLAHFLSEHVTIQVQNVETHTHTGRLATTRIDTLVRNIAREELVIRPDFWDANMEPAPWALSRQSRSRQSRRGRNPWNLRELTSSSSSSSEGGVSGAIALAEGTTSRSESSGPDELPDLILDSEIRKDDSEDADSPVIEKVVEAEVHAIQEPKQAEEINLIDLEDPVDTARIEAIPKIISVSNVIAFRLQESQRDHVRLMCLFEELDRKLTLLEKDTTKSSWDFT